MPERSDVLPALGAALDGAVDAYRSAVRCPWRGTPKAGVFGDEGQPIAVTSIGAAASLSGTVNAVRRQFGDRWKKGDLAICNDPDSGAANACEMTVVAPHWLRQNDPNLWVAFRSRIPDFGGWELGGFSPQTVDRWAEGGRIEPAKVALEGVLRREVTDLLALNSRTPNATLRCVKGMFDAARWISSKVDEYAQANKGLDWSAAFASVLEQEFQRIERALTGVREGPAIGRAAVVSSFSDAGPGDVEVAISRTSAQLSVRLEAPEVSPRPINLGRFGAVDCVIATVAAALGLTDLRSGAILRQVSVAVPDPSLVSAPLPATVGLGREVSGRAVVLATAEALARAGVRVDGEAIWGRICATELPDLLDLSTGKIAVEQAKAIRAWETQEARP